MDRLTTRALFLTLFALWLVAAAIIAFLLMGRGALRTQLADAEATRAALNGELAAQHGLTDAAQGTRAAIAAEATSVAAERAIDLATRDAQLESAAAERDALSATAAAQADQLAAQGRAAPEVAIIAPLNGATVDRAAPLEIIVVATDDEGLTAVNLAVGGETVLTDEGDDQPLRALTYSWSPPADGDYEITVQAIDVDGQATTRRIEITALDVAAANEALRETIESNVLEIRGVVPITDVVPTVYTRDELRQRILDDFLEESTPEEARDDVLVYHAFDFLPRDFELQGFFESFLGEVVAGFYDAETDEMVVVAEGDVLDASAQWTYAHEYMHALQDQLFGLEELSDESLNGDEALAFRAFVEGEAELVQFLYVDYFTFDQLDELRASFENNEPNPIVIDAPPIILAQLTFPYDAGLQFNQTLADGEDWSAVDQVWSDPPRSTEQILHPERFLAGDEPLPVPLPPLTDTLGSDWRLLDEDVLGEFYLREYLQRIGNPDDVDAAATGWGGDRYAVYYNDSGDELAMVLRTTWDTPQDRTEFRAAVATGFANRFGTLAPIDDVLSCAAGDGEQFCVADVENETIILRVPDASTAAAILAAILSS